MNFSPRKKRLYTQGGCIAFAVALHRRARWPLVKITDSWNVRKGKTPPRAGDSSALHWCVYHRSGKLLDVDGLRDPQLVVEEYSAWADDQEAAWGLTTEQDALDWIEAQGALSPSDAEVREDAARLLRQIPNT